VSVVWAELPEVNRVVGEAEARLARVQLDFGPDSNAGRAADSAIVELRAAANLLRPGATDMPGSAAALDRAEQHLREFNSAPTIGSLASGLAVVLHFSQDLPRPSR